MERGSSSSSGGRFSRRPGGSRQGGRGRSMGGARGSRQQGGGEGKPRFFRKKVSRLSTERISHVDYKNTELLLKFLTEKGKILPQRITGNNTKQQRLVARAIKRARHAGLIPAVIGHK
ncbi:MAG: 30S ribosomal protein S18 [Candidatus Omnitrophica bacterium CG11_big_fil_rev_8_21_14_0_20_45_26]|uniref:Small ribosomal subunit protein bS18 n=1 Tax=Candidatus Abzuiibacterium crystallinum TaxID=1974748 RepID=A0A2H0LSH2_9BACT|nr:MAG: 30S ribosomal protein S18 [Candidatus Omnitrophica bacterium CG11_big_fil_rev_8_21_14_0_20_45_26]PIW63412.1 MAG: 30S ribosomal protein S18 [Candidatus Omnitrophica bacterium CG12_big_fil_rev_8_21_14_0_65_45_16]